MKVKVHVLTQLVNTYIVFKLYKLMSPSIQIKDFIVYLQPCICFICTGIIYFLRIVANNFHGKVILRLFWYNLRQYSYS